MLDRESGSILTKKQKFHFLILILGVSFTLATEDNKLYAVTLGPIMHKYYNLYLFIFIVNYLFRFIQPESIICTDFAKAYAKVVNGFEWKQMYLIKVV